MVILIITFLFVFFFQSYDKQGFHCATPPPFSLGSQNSGMGPGGGYPQHLFIPAMTPHHNTTTLMHQPIHQVCIYYLFIWVFIPLFIYNWLHPCLCLSF